MDDGSRDRTFERLMAEFGLVSNGQSLSDVQIVRHTENLGIAAAMQTGFMAARGEILCTLDSDCTYDPMIICDLITPIAAGQADIVTASPYHPQGAVANVPRGRLLLSRAASWIYRQILPLPLYTFTSCCRAYRAPVARQLAFKHAGFLGVSEMLVSAILTRLRVVEVPARLEPRRYGVSKMKTLRVIGGHLGLVLRLLAGRWQNGSVQEATHGSR